MDILSYNKQSWDKQVLNKNMWTIPVSPEEIEKARTGIFQIVLTPEKPVPMDWFPQPLKDKKVLALASGGGQQAPILAAAGALVTVFDNSPLQLAQDKLVAEQNNLSLETIEGDMADLSVFADQTFDFIFHPCSNCFVPDIKKVWQEAYRVLKKGGTMVSGISNPINFIVDPELEEKGVLQLKYKVPYSDMTSLDEEERKRYTDKNEPLSFGHSLEDQIGGQINAGFSIIGFYEDGWQHTPLSKHMNGFIATRAIK
ncbi:class I SAM-dependent methyltransferase [bacterium]|nr:MAG: class I SAM-dependent methyltransferase [bacterium]